MATTTWQTLLYNENSIPVLTKFTGTVSVINKQPGHCTASEKVGQSVTYSLRTYIDTRYSAL